MEKNSLPGFGNFLAQRRLFLGIKQQELADKIGCTSANISSLEAGGATNPTQDRLRILAEVLSLDYGELVRVFVLEKYGWNPPKGYMLKTQAEEALVALRVLEARLADLVGAQK